MPDKIVTAAPYQARQCPECRAWVFTDAPPYGEDDPTKTERDWLHWEREHPPRIVVPDENIGLFPFFPYNTEPVEAVMEDVDA